MIKNCFTTIPATVVSSAPTQKGSYFNTASVDAFYLIDGKPIEEVHNIFVRFFSRESYSEGERVRLAISLAKDSKGFYNIAEFNTVTE